MVYSREKTVNKDAICLINVMSLISDKQTSGLHVSILFLTLPMLQPLILKDLTNIVIISPTITF